jgi:cephalosporin hydroxylase
MLQYAPATGTHRLPIVNMQSEPAKSRESRLARNLKLLAQHPRLFVTKVASWLRPMRADYRRLWGRGLRRWMIRYHKELLFDKVTWMGTPARKMVLDAWVYQQIIHEVKPDFIIEIGNAEGGSTTFLANMLDLLGHGEVIAVDIDHSIFQADHPRIRVITGDSLADETLGKIAEVARGRGMVIHDGDHSREHVLSDLRAYAQFVGVGSYLIVEDTVIDLFRAGDGLGSVNGPLQAVEQFVREDPRFQIDSSREYFVITFNPHGYLKRLS